MSGLRMIELFKYSNWLTETKPNGLILKDENLRKIPQFLFASFSEILRIVWHLYKTRIETIYFKEFFVFEPILRRKYQEIIKQKI